MPVRFFLFDPSLPTVPYTKTVSVIDKVAFSERGGGGGGGREIAGDKKTNVACMG